MAENIGQHPDIDHRTGQIKWRSPRRRPQISEIVNISIDVDHTLLEPPACPFCEMLMVRGVTNYEQCGPQITVVAPKFPFYQCLTENCEFGDIIVHDPQALLEFKKKELDVRRERGEKGLINQIKEDIRRHSKHVHE